LATDASAAFEAKIDLTYMGASNGAAKSKSFRDGKDC
jgi:hypothetical protein